MDGRFVILAIMDDGTSADRSHKYRTEMVLFPRGRVKRP